VELSVIIPTRHRPSQLARCLEALAHQDADPACFEILVGVDGPDSGEADVFNRVIGDRMAGFVEAFEPSGPAATRNAMIDRARGRSLLLLNDDVIPDRSLVRAHLLEQRARDPAHRPAMILGSAPWAVRRPDSLLDRLIRETSMVFFYDQMLGAAAGDPERDWGFRHAWTLNLSVPAQVVRAVGGFCEAMTYPVYEDLELAWRLREEFSLPVLFRPQAIVTHEHWYDPLSFLQRETVLGHQAWRLAEVSPACAMEMFGLDVRSSDEVAYSREFLRRHERTARRQLPMFLHLADIPASAISGGHAAAIIQMIYEQGLLVRRYLWRLGHVAAAEGRSAGEATAWLEPHAVSAT
jgi:GT2 family glycosyltransferase